MAMVSSLSMSGAPTTTAWESTLRTLEPPSMRWTQILTARYQRKSLSTITTNIGTQLKTRSTVNFCMALCESTETFSPLFLHPSSSVDKRQLLLYYETILRVNGSLMKSTLKVDNPRVIICITIYLWYN